MHPDRPMAWIAPGPGAANDAGRRPSWSLDMAAEPSGATPPGSGWCSATPGSPTIGRVATPTSWMFADPVGVPLADGGGRSGVVAISLVQLAAVDDDRVDHEHVDGDHRHAPPRRR